ncbi:MAG: hypothetical protein QW762_02595 [Candidatus Thermoplasmatota archaeon]
MKKIAIIIAFLMVAPAYVISKDSENLLKITIERVRKVYISDEQPNFSIIVNVEGEKWETKLNGCDLIIRASKEFKIKDDKDKISISIEIFEGEKRGYITPDDGILNIELDTKRGNWRGDDFLKDEDGYGHASGCSDGKINEYDYEIWFDIIYNDYDNDGLTYWEEVNIYHTNLYVSDYGTDYDNDGVAIEWEDKYGYNPFLPENHSFLDEDNDGLQNDEEYMLSEWFSDPFRQDIYIEVDYMEEYNGIKHIMPEKSIQMLYSSFSKKNIMLFIDNGIIEKMDIIPYDSSLDFDELNEIYQKYFLHNQPNNPRKGVFHYAIICHEIEFWRRPAGGMNFKRDAFVLASYYIQKWRPSLGRQIVSHASLFMHELGHQLGLNGYFGIDNEHTRFPWQLQYWLFGNYKSCMNYRYSFSLVDYSDGSHGFLDYDDWGNIALNRFDS